MRKRKINQEYLRRITSTEIRNDRMDALAFALSIKEFAEEYLGGLVTVEISGDRPGTVNLNMPAVSYLIRLITMITDDDELINLKINLDDNMTLEARFHELTDVPGVVHIVDVGRLAGFSVERSGNTLYFIAKIRSSNIMQIYATSNEDFKNLLIETHNM